MSDASMVQKVAKALCANYVEAIKGDARIYGWRQFVHAARAAIEAMREPTDDMLDEGAQMIYRREYAEAAWRAMIDEALK